MLKDTTGEAELEHLTRRDGVLYTPFERIRMKGIASIRVDGMVLHQSLHRVGQKGAEGDSTAFSSMPNGGEEGADDATD